MDSSIRLRLLCALACFAGGVADAPRRRLQDGAPSPTAYATAFATTRRTVDFNNLTFSLLSDEPVTSIGAADDFGDGLGSLKATAILFKTALYTQSPPSTSPYVAARCDFLLYKRPLTSRIFITDLTLTLFSDDGSSTHNPLAPVRSRWRNQRNSTALFINPLLFSAARVAHSAQRPDEASADVRRPVVPAEHAVLAAAAAGHVLLGGVRAVHHIRPLSNGPREQRCWAQVQRRGLCRL
jgi:hypothetical protein